ncbi:tRNA methyltransferase 10 [Bulinus truncatus]|nr:tRNA methyltransferase 10 [Bulinus truncatus]
MEENTDNKLDTIQIQEQHNEHTLSKSQLKKQLKREKWLVIKQEKRRASKQKRKQRLAEMREKGEEIGPSRKKLKTNTMKNSSCKIRVIIDLSLDDYMAEKDVNSLSCQIQHSYSANRRAANPIQLYLCSLGGKAKQRLDSIGDYKGWDIYKESLSYEELFPKESLVYLSSESPNVLTSLSEDKVYIIGGLVDHNRHKTLLGSVFYLWFVLCYILAIVYALLDAQLPTSEYLDMKTLFSILLKYTECGSWKEAFMSEMPQRKMAQLKENEATLTSQDTDLVKEGSSQSLTVETEASPQELKTDTQADLTASAKDESHLDDADSEKGDAVNLVEMNSTTDTEVNSSVDNTTAFRSDLPNS